MTFVPCIPHYKSRKMNFTCKMGTFCLVLTTSKRCILSNRILMLIFQMLYSNSSTFIYWNWSGGYKNRSTFAWFCTSPHTLVTVIIYLLLPCVTVDYNNFLTLMTFNAAHYRILMWNTVYWNGLLRNVCFTYYLSVRSKPCLQFGTAINNFAKNDENTLWSLIW